MTVEIKSFDDFFIGQRTTFTKTVTEADVYLLAGLTGDQNPLHVDAEFGKKTRFGQRVVHGVMAAGFVSAALTRLGIGHVYVFQSLRFRHPVFIGDTVTATAEIVEKLPEKQRLRVRTVCHNQRGEQVVEGEAILQCMPELFTGGSGA